MKATSIGFSLLVCALLTMPGVVVLGQESGNGWTDYLGGPDASHYSPLKQITPANVSQLETTWTYEAGDGSSFSFCPLVVGNVAYVAAKQ